MIKKPRNRVAQCPKELYDTFTKTGFIKPKKSDGSVPFRPTVVIHWSNEDAAYVAHALEYRYSVAHGDTLIEAARNIEKAIKSISNVLP